jgi:hypothetical protein
MIPTTLTAHVRIHSMIPFTPGEPVIVTVSLPDNPDEIITLKGTISECRYAFDGEGFDSQALLPTPKTKDLF